MMSWYKLVIDKLRQAGIFSRLEVIGGKVRATIDATRFLDIHCDPVHGSYSYALIDLRLPFPGDKRIFGWDDYPHEGITELQAMSSYPHHFQMRHGAHWAFEESEMRGDVEKDVEVVIVKIKSFLTSGL